MRPLILKPGQVPPRRATVSLEAGRLKIEVVDRKRSQTLYLPWEAGRDDVLRRLRRFLTRKSRPISEVSFDAEVPSACLGAIKPFI